MHSWSLFDLPRSSALFGFAGFATFLSQKSATLTSIFHPFRRFLYFPGACSTFLDLQIDSFCLIWLSAFHCQSFMMALTSEPCEINSRKKTGDRHSICAAALGKRCKIRRMN
jgi:hypothetical protein